jgi:hypothetical protein
VEFEARMRANREAEQVTRFATQQIMMKILQYMHVTTGVPSLAMMVTPPAPLPPPRFSTPMIWKFYSCMIYIYLVSHTISFLCRINRRHQMTLMLCPTLHHTNLTGHLVDALMNLLVMFVKLINFGDTW